MARNSYSVEKLKIEKEIIKLQKKAQALQQKQRNPVITSIIRSMREYDITPEEITAAFTKKPARGAAEPKHAAAAKRTVPVKYRHPQTGDTWTGRGKAPRWIMNAEAQGKKRDAFLVAAPDSPGQRDRLS